MNQLHLFGGGGEGEKAERAEYKRKCRAKKKKSGICQDCPAPALPGKTRCMACLERSSDSVANRRAKLIEDGKCCECGQFPIAESSRRYCVSCLGKKAEYNRARLSTIGGRWLEAVGAQTRHVATGYTNSSPSYFNWTHEDFCVKFVDWAPEGDSRCIDHIIHKSCAVGLDGEKDLEFGALAFDLANLQLISSSANKRKGYDLDRKVLTKSNELRARGLSGAQLFHALWNEFSEDAQRYGDLVE
jgi:hypothetical protein